MICVKLVNPIFVIGSSILEEETPNNEIMGDFISLSCT